MLDDSHKKIASTKIVKRSIYVIFAYDGDGNRMWENDVYEFSLTKAKEIAEKIIGFHSPYYRCPDEPVSRPYAE